MNFWERVDILLEQKGLTRKELAVEADFDVSNIGKGISNNNSPSADMAVRIARVLDTSVEFLVTGQDVKISKSIVTDLDLLLKYSATIHELNSIPDESKAPIVNMISDMSSKYTIKNTTRR